MPIYEFVCNGCNTEFELRLSFSEIASTALCPECYSDAQRLISSFACKTGSNLQASEKPFRKQATKKPPKNTQTVTLGGPGNARKVNKARNKK